MGSGRPGPRRARLDGERPGCRRPRRFVSGRAAWGPWLGCRGARRGDGPGRPGPGRAECGPGARRQTAQALAGRPIGGAGRPRPGAKAGRSPRPGRRARPPRPDGHGERAAVLRGPARTHDLVVTPRGPHGATLRQGGRRCPCVVGRGGVASAKREGDGTTPVGAHRIAGLMWRPDRMARPAPWARPIGAGALWCDDPAHPAYNRLVRAPFAGSAERLRRADPLYDLVLLTDWNAEGVPEGGSAIFVHRWRRAGMATEGCIALAPSDLLRLAKRARPGTRLIVRP